MRFLVLTLSALTLAGQTLEQPARSVTDPGVVTTRQQITPAGVPSVFNGRVYGVAFGSAPNEVWVLHASFLYRMDWQSNRVLARLPLEGNAGLQGIAFDREADRAIVASPDRKRMVRLLSARAEGLQPIVEGLGSQIAGAVAAGGGVAAVPLIFNNEVAVVDLQSGKLRGKVKTQIAPFGAVVHPSGKIAYVTNWGGRLPRSGDLTAPTGLAKEADQVVVDKRGIASTGTVTRVDLEKLTVTHTVPVELHPTAIAWDAKRDRVYVANGNKDSISVIDSSRNQVVATYPLQPFSTRVSGIAPTALALDADGSTLYVACGGINAVLVMNPATGAITGSIPTAWYPNHLSLSPDGKLLAISALLGAGSGWQQSPGRRFVHSNRGAISVVPLPDKAQLAAYTTAVAENNRMPLTAPRLTPSSIATAIPTRSGDPSLIEHVVYIIKENRTYDQLFGDLRKGNGDPSLVMFGQDVTPNHRRLAEQYVLLDNFYATGGNSGDGHQWVTQANETAYCMWPGYTGRSYPFDGSDPIAYASSGFIWDLALARGKTVRVFGEYAGRQSESPEERVRLLAEWKKGGDFNNRWKITAPIGPLNKILAANYPSYTNGIPDVVRARIFLSELKKWEADGKMPNLTILQLPSDHTFGTRAGTSSPKAMVADNDLALGQIVEGLSRSRFWPKMAIFVVEDDAQNGVDHVDGHRTVALAVSPYTRRGHVDSTFYSNQSIVKTIELILGLPTLSLFDLIAHDMRNSFQNTPDLTPYEPVTPKQSLEELNPPVNALKGKARAGALASARMKWNVPDAAPTGRLNRILWGSINGWNVPYPEVRQAVFAPLAIDVDDDDR